MREHQFEIKKYYTGVENFIVLSQISNVRISIWYKKCPMDLFEKISLISLKISI